MGLRSQDHSLLECSRIGGSLLSEEPRHIVSFSAGKDSAALAIYMRDRVPDMEYIFHDTGKELPETYDYIARLENILGTAIVCTTLGRLRLESSTTYGFGPIAVRRLLLLLSGLARI
jgi:3'-phosphoadenosine 5'-phosphosulfate sulfotransferase (PAPS reductase)/FAD synthetase